MGNWPFNLTDHRSFLWHQSYVHLCWSTQVTVSLLSVICKNLWSITLKTVPLQSYQYLKTSWGLVYSCIAPRKEMGDSRFETRETDLYLIEILSSSPRFIQTHDLKETLHGLCFCSFCSLLIDI
jgi:hypothetical protein